MEPYKIFQETEPLRLTGFDRYRELIDRDFKRFFFINLLTIIAFIPFFFGLIYSILSSSFLLLIPTSLIGGIFCGPAICGMYDIVLRSLRDSSRQLLVNYKKAMKQNFTSSILPGIVFCSLLSFYFFMFSLFYWAEIFPSAGTLILYFIGLLFFFSFFNIFWTQTVLFSQPITLSIKNTFLFMLRYLKRIFIAAVLSITYYTIIIFLLPWSVVLILFLGFWFPIFFSVFLLYEPLNACFHIEEQIAEISIEKDGE